MKELRLSKTIAITKELHEDLKIIQAKMIEKLGHPVGLDGVIRSMIKKEK